MERKYHSLTSFPLKESKIQAEGGGVSSHEKQTLEIKGSAEICNGKDIPYKRRNVFPPISNFRKNWKS
jgi:hypothetical protein